VVTPNYMHAPVARAAIAAGKPVSCEKPIAGSLKALPIPSKPCLVSSGLHETTR